MKERILAYVTEKDWVTFPELVRLIGPEAEGPCSLEDLGANIVYWDQMSQAFGEALQNLQREKKIFKWPASVLIYAIDGAISTLPIAKKLPKSGKYKSPRWLPICFRPIPHPASVDQGQG